jgi:hypothetical protein
MFRMAQHGEHHASQQAHRSFVCRSAAINRLSELPL